MNDLKQKISASKNNSRRWIKRLLWGTLLLGVSVGIVFAALPQPIEVELSTVEKGPLVVRINEDGVSRIHDRYIVSSPLAGNLARLELHAGDEVKQGQVLARILPLSAPLLDTRTRHETEARVAAALAGLRQANAQIERAKARLDFAAKEAKSTGELARSGTISTLELERAKLEERSSRAEVSSAEFASKVASHELSMARSALSRFRGNASPTDDQLEVTSPTTGRVLKVFQQSEGVVQAGAALLEIGNPKALEIAVDVLTSDAVEIVSGAPVSLSGWGGPPLDAVVRLVEPAAFSRVSSLGVEEQRVNTIIDLKAPYDEWERLGDGYRVEAGIQVYVKESALKIPWSCLFRDDGNWAVYIEENGVAKKVDVLIGRRNETHAEILEGLSPGTRVLRHPNDNVRDGVAIQNIK